MLFINYGFNILLLLKNVDCVCNIWIGVIVVDWLNDDVFCCNLLFYLIWLGVFLLNIFLVDFLNLNCLY